MPALTDHAVDEVAIRHLAARFADVCTVDDAEGFRALWTPDCVWEISDPFPIKAEGLDNVLQLYNQLRSPHEFFVQMPHAGVVRVDGAKARARWMMQEVGRNQKTGLNYNNFGLYLDTLVRADNGWLFAKRSYQYIWVDTSTQIVGQSLEIPASVLHFV
jgi:SnoaL-like domain